jgi:hypothetical protein
MASRNFSSQITIKFFCVFPPKQKILHRFFSQMEIRKNVNKNQQFETQALSFSEFLGLLAS